MLRHPLPPVMARLHELLEHYDEYERPVRGFFITELDANSRDPSGRPVLLYVRPDSLHSGAGAPGPRPPDWIGEVLPAGQPSRLEKYARAGVGEYWRIWVEEGPEGTVGIRFERHLDVAPEEGRYASVEVVPDDRPVATPVFPGIGLRPRDLLDPPGSGPLARA